VSADETTAAATITDDQQRLHELGYAQELRRHMSVFTNFAVSFTIISILSGCLTLYGTGLNWGGPVIITWGWPFVGVMTLFVGLAMAEVCSSFPTAGGLYYWSAKLAPRNPAAWSWFTGWFNFLGQVAVTAGIDFGAAFFLNAQDLRAATGRARALAAGGVPGARRRRQVPGAGRPGRGGAVPGA
jgi:amino acid transporter